MPLLLPSHPAIPLPHLAHLALEQPALEVSYLRPLLGNRQWCQYHPQVEFWKT